MTLQALTQLLDQIKSKRVACIGDVMVDRFVYGSVHRVSPEAPIPVLSRAHEQVMLGGAGNVARNLATLGGEVALVGVIGKDAEGRQALRLCEDQGEIEANLIQASHRPTTVKTRFVAGGQQLLRVDNEDTSALDDATRQSLIHAIRSSSHDADVILISDYAKGALCSQVILACQDLAGQAPIIVDPKGRDFAKYGAVDLIKPNAAELSMATDLPCNSDQEVEIALSRALEMSQAKAILVTRAAQGMSFMRRGEAVVHVRARPREVFDVSGAGDTGLAALGLALAAKASLEDAAAFAVLASGVAVEKIGTAAVTPEDLINAELTAHSAPVHAKIVTDHLLEDQIEAWRAQGLKIGFTNGCFDILHSGHIAYLSQAKAWCDRLVVGLNSDASIRGLKGEGRPVNELESRAMVLAGLSAVDLVCGFDAPTPLDLIKQVKPDVLIKGADYSLDKVVGADFVIGYGGVVRLADFVDGFSTTKAINRIKANAS